MENYLNTVHSLETFDLDERFSRPLRSYYYNLRSLNKYWTLTKNLMVEEITQYKEVFENLESDEEWSEEPYDDINLDLPAIDGEEMEHDYSHIPFYQKNLIICSGLAMIESLLKEVCSEIEKDYSLNGKGSYIQQFRHFLKHNSKIVIQKNFLNDFETFGHIRNSFIHQLDTSIPDKSSEYINNLTGRFVNVKNGISNIHVEIFLNIMSNFGADFQKQYWSDYDERTPKPK